MKRYKTMYNKKTGEVRIEYFKLQDKNAFRFSMLTELLKDEELFLWIDTNLIGGTRTPIHYVKEMETYTARHHIPMEIIPTASTKEKKIFGVRIKASEERAFILVMPMKGEAFNQEFFDTFLSEGDIMVGIRPKKPYEELAKDVQRGFLKGCFDKEYFEDALYDSLLISAVRTTLVKARDI